MVLSLHSIHASWGTTKMCIASFWTCVIIPKSFPQFLHTPTSRWVPTFHQSDTSRACCTAWCWTVWWGGSWVMTLCLTTTRLSILSCLERTQASQIAWNCYRGARIRGELCITVQRRYQMSWDVQRRYETGWKEKDCRKNVNRVCLDLGLFSLLWNCAKNGLSFVDGVFCVLWNGGSLVMMSQALSPLEALSPAQRSHLDTVIGLENKLIWSIYKGSPGDSTYFYISWRMTKIWWNISYKRALSWIGQIKITWAPSISLDEMENTKR